jgi:multimeric flavodoxin WrbA
MNVLTLVGSYRRNGNTGRLLAMLQAELKAIAYREGHPLRSETLFLGHQDLRPCRGCRLCFDRGEGHCPLKDDLLAVKEKMRAADAVILGSPVYVNDVSGIVKNWIDRLAHVCHRPEFAGKCAYLIATVGDSPTSHTLRTMNIALSTWGFHIVGQRGFQTGALMKPPLLAERYQAEIEGIARKLYIATRERHFTNPSFLSLMTFRIQQNAYQRAARDTLDYAYWKGHGWTNPDSEFFIRHDASRAKVTLARLAGGVIAKYVS